MNDPNILLMLFYIFGALMFVGMAIIYYANKKSKKS